MKDGIALKPFKEQKFTIFLGIDIIKNLANLANKSNIKTIKSFFDKKILKK